MNKIVKVKSEFENEWLLHIGGAKVGSLEVVFLSDTSRTVNGQVTVYALSDGKEITYKYRGEDTKRIYSISQFIADAMKAIGDVELRLNPGDEYTDDGRLFNNIVLVNDIDENNVDDMITHLKIKTPFGWESQSLFQKVGYVQSMLREEQDKKQAVPMYDLIQKVKMGSARATPLKDCWE